MERISGCDGCPYIRECGTMISCFRLVKAGMCQIHNKEVAQKDEEEVYREAMVELDEGWKEYEENLIEEMSK